ncbi:MAG: hypothetical protein M1822_005837 [Bathelium mastoideum]|nr:MAG: hypothetical protein M1822_005837 [Bathelium mastoideum]
MDGIEETFAQARNPIPSIARSENSNTFPQSAHEEKSEEAAQQESYRNEHGRSISFTAHEDGERTKFDNISALPTVRRVPSSANQEALNQPIEKKAPKASELGIQSAGPRRELPSRLLLSVLRPVYARQFLPETGTEEYFQTKTFEIHDKTQYDGAQGKSASAFESQANDDPSNNPGQVSLQSIVARYIVSDLRLNDSVRQRPIYRSTDWRPAYSATELEFLQKRGYDTSDIKQWAAIILSPSGRHAALHLSELQSRMRDRSSRDAPLFLVLLLLRCRPMTVETLKLLLRHVWKRDDIFARDRFRQRRDADSSDATAYRNTVLEYQTGNLPIIHRLIEQALMIWPAAIVNIADLAVKLLEGETLVQHLTVQDLKLSNMQLTRLSKYYNSILAHLSRTATIDKYKSTIFQQRAQFDLLARMAEHRPPLTVTQVGYRALIIIQLAQRKNSRERDWANLKSKTWPPWKQDQTGLDAEKGLEYSMTRAAMVIRKMQEAGYGTTQWERVAKIFTGWNTDDTPTIQRRAFIHAPPRVEEGSKKSVETKLQVQLWAARIQTTRTVREAWGCFLSCRSQGLSERSAVCTSMLEKLVYEERRCQLNEPELVSGAISSPTRKIEAGFSREDPYLSGDGREIHPPPISPLETMYLPSEPPSVDNFFEQMIRNNVPVSDTCLAFLMDNATSLAQARYYLVKSRPSSHVDSLINRLQEPMPELKLSRLVFTCLIRAYCRFDNVRPYHTYSFARLPGYQAGSWVLRSPPSLIFALKLLDMLKIDHRPAWNAALSSLRAMKRFFVAGPGHPLSDAMNRIIAFDVAHRLCASMRFVNLDPDYMNFLHLCSITQSALIASFRIQAKEKGSLLGNWPHSPRMLEQTLEAAKKITASSSKSLRDIFVSLVGGVGSDLKVSKRKSRSKKEIDALSPFMPRLLTTPPPVAFHAFVRALGLGKNFGALRNLTRWMVTHKPELDIQIHAARNGRRQFRRTITALAVFVERSTVGVDLEPIDSEALEEIALECRQLIEGVGEEWGGWPTEEEIEAYVAPEGRSETDEWLLYL